MAIWAYKVAADKNRVRYSCSDKRPKWPEYASIVAFENGWDQPLASGSVVSENSWTFSHRPA